MWGFTTDFWLMVLHHEDLSFVLLSFTFEMLV